MASREIYDLAAEEVTLRRKSLRDAAYSYNLNHTSLYRYIKKKLLMKLTKRRILRRSDIQKRLFLQLQKKKYSVTIF